MRNKKHKMLNAGCSARPRFRRLALLAAGLALLPGCEAPGPASQPGSAGPPRSGRTGLAPEIDPQRVPTRDDITQIVQFWGQLPWRKRDDRIIGFQVPTYFVSGQTDRGAFVPGRILVWLYEVDLAGPAGANRTLRYMWELDQAEAMGFRVRREAIGGYYYGFILTWDDSLDLEGRTVDIQFGYERLDGRVIEGRPQRLRVPLSGPRPASGRAAG